MHEKQHQTQRTFTLIFFSEFNNQLDRALRHLSEGDSRDGTLHTPSHNPLRFQKRRSHQCTVRGYGTMRCERILVIYSPSVNTFKVHFGILNAPLREQ